jgi:hypothetical protein
VGSRWDTVRENGRLCRSRMPVERSGFKDKFGQRDRTSLYTGSQTSSVSLSGWFLLRGNAEVDCSNPELTTLLSFFVPSKELLEEARRASISGFSRKIRFR